MTDEEYSDLNKYSTATGIPFSASVFDPMGLELLASFRPPYVKIASCDLNNVRFLKQVASYGIRMIVSTGMSTLSDINTTINEIAKTGFNDIVLLHCVSVYPAKIEQTNLNFITTLKSEFGFPVGFSDHTPTSHAACMALTLGATWFEKHFTEAKNQKGLDHAYALEEHELKAYIDNLQAAHLALRPKEDKISENELYTRRRARRSLYAARDLSAGHLISDSDVLCVRPENIMQANEIDLIVGQRLTSEIKQYQPFSPDKVR